MPPVFRYTLSRFFCFMQEKRFFYFPLRREWADRVVRPYIQKRWCDAGSQGWAFEEINQKWKEENG